MITDGDILESFGSLVDGLTGQEVSRATIRNLINTKKLDLQPPTSRGDFVIFKMANGPDFFVTLFCCWELELIPVIMPPRSTPSEIENVRRAFQARAVLKDGGHGYFAESGTATLALPAEVRQSTALVLLTSGTLGDPKAIFLPFAALSEKFSALESAIPFADRHNTMCLLPLCFGHGLICNSLFPLLTGSTLTVFPAFDLSMTAAYVDAIRTQGIHFFSSVPVVLKVLLQHPLGDHQLRRVHCASAPLFRGDWQAADRWLGDNSTLRHVYGLTEFSGWVAGAEPLSPRASGYVGQPWGVEIQLREQSGEILLRGGGCMSGYLDGGQFHSVERNGWFATGDLGTVDGRGSLTLIGRQKDIINFGGFKVHPLDIDRLLAQHPAIREVCSFAMHNENIGEMPAVACVLNRQISEKELKSWCAERIHANKVPVRWFFVDRLPTTERGKISRSQVRQFCENAAL